MTNASDNFGCNGNAIATSPSAAPPAICTKPTSADATPASLEYGSNA